MIIKIRPEALTKYRIRLPYRAGRFTFNPGDEVPDDRAEAMLKTDPHLYMRGDASDIHPLTGLPGIFERAWNVMPKAGLVVDPFQEPMQTPDASLEERAESKMIDDGTLDYETNPLTGDPLAESSDADVLPPPVETLDIPPDNSIGSESAQSSPIAMLPPEEATTPTPKKKRGR